MRVFLATLILCLAVVPSQAKPSRLGPVTQFVGDRYAPVAQMSPSARDVTRAMRCSPMAGCTRAQRRKVKPRIKRRPSPGYVSPRTAVKRNIFRAFAEEVRNAGPSKSLAGVVAPLAAKARELQSVCGARIISAVRHTYIAGTGGRLSLHASGRAVDIIGNPSCLYANLRGFPGGVSIDYGRVKHVHISWNPGGSEWGMRFNHYRGKVRKPRFARRRA